MLDVTKMTNEQIQMLYRHLNTLIFAYMDLEQRPVEERQIFQKTLDKHIAIAKHFVESLPVIKE